MKIWNDSDRLWGLVIRLLVFGLICKTIAIIGEIIIVIKR